MKKPLVIGKILGIHGIKGNLKVAVYSESLAFFDTGCQLQIGAKGMFTVSGAKSYKRGLLLSLETVDCADVAEKLVGEQILIDRKSLPRLDEDMYYWADLIGLKVFSLKNEYLGGVESIIATGSNDVFVVRDQEKEILIPALVKVVKKIDLENDFILVDLPEGLR